MQPETVAVTVVGSLNVDLVARVPRLPGPGETVGSGVLSRHPGGKGANQAAALGRLGATVRMAGAVGDDADGTLVLDALRRACVVVDDVVVAGPPTGTAVITIDAAGENQIAVCGGANDAFLPDPSVLAAAPVVLTQLEITDAAVDLLVTHAAGYLAVNAAPARHLSDALVGRADLIIVNETEYAALPEVAAARLVAVTYGGDGAVLLRHGTEIARTAAFPAQPVNTVGAGDAFCAALTLGLAGGVEPETALRAAAAVGAAAVEDAGSQPALKDYAHYTGLALAG